MTTAGDTEPTTIGRYELSSTLGVGGFAAVYRAHDPALDGDVAVKVLLPHVAGDADVRARFVQEARLLRRVPSPHVVRVHDVGELDDGRPYFVMELADGGVLSARRRGPVDRRSLARVVDALAAGLGALHAANVVHRDIKPDNLLVTRAAGTGPAGPTSASASAGGGGGGGGGGAAGGGRGGVGAGATEIVDGMLAEHERVVIGDLGLAKDHDRTAVGPTVAGGTPRYRPPEQMTPGADVTPAADVYAATGVLWFLLTGEPPPETDAVPIHLPTLPPAWQPVLERGLQADPTLRHATVAEWAADARRAVDASPATGIDPGSMGDLVGLCPYKGMAAFQPEDAGLFFGRDDLVDTLVARLQDHPVVVIGGPSGSGKSSLLRAGLIPRLARGAIAGSQNWPVALFNPGADAVGELLHQLRRLADRATSSDAVTGAGRAAGGGRAAGAELTRDDLPAGARRLLDDGPPVVLAIDQFEELFTLNPSRADQELFLDTLAELTGTRTGTGSNEGRCRVALALRADFYGACATHPWLGERINESQLLVGPMSRRELRDAVTVPAQRAGLAVEAGLADAIVDDVGSGAGALPLLGHALMETWIRRRGGHLTLEGYRAAGGVSGAIAQRAEEVHRAMAEPEREATRRLFLQLVNPGQGTPDTRRRVVRDALPDDPALAAVLEKLTAARLLTVDGGEVEVAHEALIQSWPRLRTWIDEDRESLLARRRIGAAATEWDLQERDPDLLYRGSQLSQALEWWGEHPGELAPTGEAFLTEARDVRDRAEAQREAAGARMRRTRRLAVGALAALAVAAVISSVVALAFLREARDNEQVAVGQQAEALATAASGNADDNPILATRLALEAMARTEPAGATARAALVEARVGMSDQRMLPLPYGPAIPVGDALSVTITPDGERFLVGGRNGDVVVYDRTGREEQYRIERVHGSGVKDLAVSPDGRWMASIGKWGASLWDLTAEPLGPVPLHEIAPDAGDQLWDVTFSADGTLVGLSTEKSGVLVFDVAGRTLVSHGTTSTGSDVLSIAFLDDDRLAAADGTGMLWMLDLASGEPRGEPVVAGERGNDIWQLVYEPEREVLATLSTDDTVKLFDVGGSGYERRAVIEGSDLDDPAGGVLVRSGRELVVGTVDGDLHRIDLETGEALLGVGGVSGSVHTDRIVDASVGSDWLVTLGDDQRVQVWNLLEEDVAVDTVLAEVGPVVELAGSPDGSRLATAGTDGVVVLEARTGQVVRRLGAGTEAIESVAWVGDDRVVTGGGDGRLALWDVDGGGAGVDGALVAEIRAHDGRAIRALVVTADGATVVSGGDDGGVARWSGADLSSLGTVGGDGGAVSALVLMPDGETVASLHWNRSLWLWPLEGGGDGGGASGEGGGRRIEVSVDGPQALVVHPDGATLAVGGSDERVDIIDLDGRVLRSMAPHPGGVWDLALTDDGLSLAATGRGAGLGPTTLQLWDWATGERLGFPFGTDADPARREGDVVAGPGGVLWWSGADGTVRRLDVLDTEVGCRLSEGVMGEAMRRRFVLGDDLAACDG